MNTLAAGQGVEPQYQHPKCRVLSPESAEGRLSQLSRCGTWIRTKIAGSKVPSPTIRRSRSAVVDVPLDDPVLVGPERFELSVVSLRGSCFTTKLRTHTNFTPNQPSSARIHKSWNVISTNTIASLKAARTRRCRTALALSIA